MLLITALPPLAARKFLLPHVPGAREQLILNQLWGEVTRGISCVVVVVEILSGAASSAATSERSGAVPIVLFIRKPSLIFFFLFFFFKAGRADDLCLLFQLCTEA